MRYEKEKNHYGTQWMIRSDRGFPAVAFHIEHHDFGWPYMRFGAEIDFATGIGLSVYFFHYTINLDYYR